MTVIAHDDHVSIVRARALLESFPQGADCRIDDLGQVLPASHIGTFP